MGKNSRLTVKIIGIVFGMLLIGYILAVSLRMNGMKQPEGEGIRLADALILTEAFREDSKETAGYKELQKIAAADRESLLTYAQLLELTDMLRKETEEKTASGMTAELEAIDREYGSRYKAEYYVLQEDWYRLYEELLDTCGMEEIIYPVNVTILGMAEDVTGENAAAGDGTGENADAGDVTGGKLLAEEGSFRYRSDLFSQYKYQVIRAYRKGDTLLTVRGVVSRGMNLHNIWIMEADNGRLQVFYKDHEIWFPYDKAEKGQREQIADLDFADGSLRLVKIKGDKINGKLLSIRDGKLEIEGFGKYPYEQEMKVYRLYGGLDECGQEELRIGYDFTDFVLDDGVICAGLVTRDEAMENIRVVIKNTDYAGAYHEKAELTSDTDFVIRYGKYGAMEKKEFQAGDIVTIDGESEYFTGDRIYIEASALTGRIKLLSVRRAQGTPFYRGKMEIARTSDGLVIVNELLLEEYLYSVVPSEMPASYPLEALKAQAVCARTYAYRYMSRSGIAGFGAHVDDSAGYQVYNNIAENAETTKAVKETSGRLLYYGDALCGAYYYSTSCGFGTDAEIWKSDSGEDTSYLQAGRIGEQTELYDGESMKEEDTFEEFISKGYPSDFESGEAWYRWTYRVKVADAEQMLERIRKRYEANEKLVLTKNRDGEYESRKVEKLGAIRDIYISRRNSGGVADELMIEGTENTYRILSEYNIRYVLNDGTSRVVRQDGSQVASPTLLPSAYLVITAGKEDDIVVGYSLTGGGYGHGVGMSQNGAREMAKRDFTAEHILAFFYPSCEVRNIYK